MHDHEGEIRNRFELKLKTRVMPITIASPSVFACTPSGIIKTSLRQKATET